MRPHIILRYIGFVLLFNAIFLFFSAVISAFNSDSSFFPLLYSSVISALFGAFPLIFVPSTTKISNKEGFIIVISSWLLSCLAGCIPYIDLKRIELRPFYHWAEKRSGIMCSSEL
ncbi:MAG TPA: hypothetical protein PLS62_07990 [Desulfobacteraceae bacterium]|nr:hypothetical protein [Desulfobacteraceae bacterium]